MATLIRPPPENTSLSAIENTLELTRLSDIDTNLFTNTRPLWHPPGARGVYGGSVIAQCLSAAQKTVPRTFTIHSMHCYFVLAGNAEIPVIYHVEHVREGKSFATRTVQARQRGKAIFTTTMSFAREGSGGKETVDHACEMPDVPPPCEDDAGNIFRQRGTHAPFESQRIEILNNDSPHPHTKRTRQWIRARGKISPNGGHEAHLSALAYMSDSYFIGTVARVHKLWRFSLKRPGQDKESAGNTVVDEDVLKKLMNMDAETLRRHPDMDEHVIEQLKNGMVSTEGKIQRPEVGMMVSLDHTIYFHTPRDFRADEWLFTEMDTPWAGDGRGLVQQRIFTRDGRLVATCIQEVGRLTCYCERTTY